MDFKQFGLSMSTIDTLEKIGYSEATPIQSQVIPEILNTNKDIIIQSATGSGKTASFGIPLIENLRNHDKGIHALVLAPTRELAMQVSEQLHIYKGSFPINVISVCGGQSIMKQCKDIKGNKKPAIIVGTPGRIIDLLQKRVLNFQEIKYLVLDEVDEMLKMGFKEEVDTILAESSEEKRSIVLSATLPKPIRTLLDQYLSDPKTIKHEQSEKTTSNIEQFYYVSSAKNKEQLLFRVIDQNPDFYGIVFCSTKRETESIVNILIANNYKADFLHGDLSQAQRNTALSKFKSKKISILVVTDVAARGIDIKNISHVINYDLPQNPEIYTHRIGRTGRAGETGKAVSFVKTNELHKFKWVQKKMDGKIKELEPPSIESLLESKKLRLINDVVEAKPWKEFSEIAEELLESNDPKSLIEKLLTLKFRDDFDVKKYKEVRNKDFKSKNRDFKNRDSKGKNRGFKSQRSRRKRY